MLYIIEPEPCPQPSDRLGRIDSKPPLERCDPVTRLRIGTAIETMPTMHRATFIEITHGGESITPATLGAGPTLATQ
jgi:hypothetical protein